MSQGKRKKRFFFGQNIFERARRAQQEEKQSEYQVTLPYLDQTNKKK